jgi:hypothetical protein
MLAIYEKLQKEGKIGPFDANGRPRAFVEYPKQMRQPRYELVRRAPTPSDPQGTFDRVLIDPGVVVWSQREELAFLSENGQDTTGQDPILDERNDLRKEVDALRKQLEEAIAALNARSMGTMDVTGGQAPNLSPTPAPARTPPPKPSR